jgi:hypothetical protein
MADREREYADLGVEYAEGIEEARVVEVPSTGRIICRRGRTWWVQPRGDNYWVGAANLFDALLIGMGLVRSVVELPKGGA